MASRSGVLEAVTERPRELLDDLDLRDRASGFADEVQKRRKDLSKRSQQAAKRTRKLTAEAVDRAEDLRGFVGDPRDRAEELREVALDVSGSVRDRAEDLQPLVRKLAIDVLTAFRAVIGVLLFVPQLIVRAIGLFGDLLDRAEVAKERGYELSERARDAAHAVPPSRRMRRRRRVRTTVLVGGGFVVGFVTGWLLAQRVQEVRDAELAPALQPVGEPLRPVPPEQQEVPEAPEEPGAGTGA